MEHWRPMVWDMRPGVRVLPICMTIGRRGKEFVLVVRSDEQPV